MTANARQESLVEAANLSLVERKTSRSTVSLLATTNHVFIALMYEEALSYFQQLGRMGQPSLSMALLFPFIRTSSVSYFVLLYFVSFYKPPEILFVGCG